MRGSTALIVIIEFACIANLLRIQSSLVQVAPWISARSTYYALDLDARAIRKLTRRGVITFLISIFVPVFLIVFDNELSGITVTGDPFWLPLFALPFTGYLVAAILWKRLRCGRAIEARHRHPELLADPPKGQAVRLGFTNSAEGVSNALTLRNRFWLLRMGFRGRWKRYP